MPPQRRPSVPGGGPVRRKSVELPGRKPRGRDGRRRSGRSSLTAATIMTTASPSESSGPRARLSLSPHLRLLDDLFLTLDGDVRLLFDACNADARPDLRRSLFRAPFALIEGVLSSPRYNTRARPELREAGQLSP